MGEKTGKRTHSIFSILICVSILLISLSLKGNISNKSPSNPIKINSRWSSNGEVRAVWLNDYAFNSQSTRADTLKKIGDANLNTIFLIAPPIGENNGWSDVIDFEHMLASLKDKEYAVYVWICNLYRVKGTKADYTNSSERNAQKNWALALLNEYEQLDGIHLDYIRYENLSIVNFTQMNGVQETISLIKGALDAEFPNKTLSTASLPLSGEIRDPEDYIPPWYDIWFNNIQNNAVNRWDSSGYNNSGIPTPFRVQQDPRTWIVTDAIDFTISMEYSYSTSWWKGEVDIWNSWMSINISRVFMGLGYYSRKWEDPSITPTMVAEEIVEKVHYGRAHNITGFSIFEFGEPGNDDYILINALTSGHNAPFKEEGSLNGTIGDQKTFSILLSVIFISLLALAAFTTHSGTMINQLDKMHLEENGK